jgi:hypothetical protein
MPGGTNACTRLTEYRYRDSSLYKAFHFKALRRTNIHD